MEALQLHDPNQYLIEAINSLTKAQIALTQKMDKYIKESDLRFKLIDDKLNKQDVIIESLYIDYIKRLTTEVAEHYGIQEKKVDYETIRRYRENSKHEHDLRFNSIHSRLCRIYWLKDITNIHSEYYSELCGRIGKTKGQIREEPHAIAIHFKHDCGVIHFPEALELNKHYMQIANDLVFELEMKYGINDKDKNYSYEVARKLVNSEEKVIDYKDNDFIEWIYDIIKEYSWLCNTNEDNTQQILFDYVSKFARKYKYFNMTFGDNLSSNIHAVLSNKTIKKDFSMISKRNLMCMWNKRKINLQISNILI